MSGSSTIIANRLAPLTQIAFDNSQAGAAATVLPAILIAQTLIAQPAQLFPAFSVSQVQSLCGRGSMMDRLFQSYFALDTQGPIYIFPVADASGSVAATGSFTIAGTATGAGSISLYIAGQRVAIAVTIGMTAVQAAAAAVAAINADEDLPVTAVAADAPDMTLRKVTLTATQKGTLGNMIDLRVNYYGIKNGEVLPAGLSITFTAMASGATDPDLTQVFPVIADAPGRFFVHPYTGSAALTAGASALNFSGGRWSPTRKSWGHIFTANGQGSTALLALPQDDPHHSIFGYETGSPTPEWEAAGMWAGAMAISLRTQPNLPVQTLQLPNFKPPLQQLESAGGPFSATTRETLLEGGIGCCRYDKGVPQIVRAVTTYTTNAEGTPDSSYQDTEDMFLLMAIADRIEAFENNNLGRTLIADNGTKTAPGISEVTPAGITGMLVALYSQMEFDGLVEDASAFIAASSVARNLTNPSEVDILYAPYLVVGLRQIANTVQFRKYSAAAAAAAQITT